MKNLTEITAIAIGMIIALAFYGALTVCAVAHGGAVAINHLSHQGRKNRRQRRAERRWARR